GSSAPAVDFNITLNSCIAGTYYPVTGGFVQGNFANIQLDAIRGSTVVDADRGMLGLSPSANPDEDARGVAVQVLQPDGTTPMTLGMPVQLNRITNGTTLVPLKARYIQIGDGHSPTPGTANAYASFTVTYR
ncbi:MAG: fimbrial protein, partial [Stenotrophomonas maltophilia]